MVLAGAGNATADPVRALAAHEVVNRVGVQTHIAWPETTYRKRFDEVEKFLDDLGVRSIRDALGSASANRLYRRLWDKHGIRILAVADARTGVDSERRPEPNNVAKIINGAKLRIGAKAILGFEGTNEANQLEAQHRVRNWPEILRDYMQELNNVVKNDRDLKHLPILAPAMAQPANEYWYERAGDFSDLSDLGNGHIYGTYRSLSSKLDEVLPVIDRMRPGSPIWASEFGWQTAANSGGLWIDEDSKVKYLGRAILELAARPSVQRGFIYQLIDHVDDPQQLDRKAHFGLIDYDLRPKPSFYAVRNIMHILCDDAFTGKPDTLDLEFKGVLDNLRTLLLQKNNGVFYLAVWLDVQSVRRNRPVFIPSQEVTISFGETMQRVRIFRPADPTSYLASGRTPWDQLNGTRVVTVDVPDHPLIIELLPRGIEPTEPEQIKGCDFKGT